ncbi:Major facilitator super domain-containing protein 1 [Homalodisca vitripennis]|nr:Major facilitator super domain-containing protein 1 [Homalodisca vitripennis]
MCHLNLDNLMDVQELHITNRKCRDSGSNAGDDCWSLVGFVPYQRFLLASTRVCHPLPALTGEARGGPYPLPPNLIHPEYPITPKAALRIGGESLAVAQNNYAVVWFMGKELNTVFGLQLSFARVGSTVNLVVLGPLYNWVEQFYHGHTCLGVTLFIATATCVMSLLAALLLGLLRKKKDTSARDNPNNEVARITDIKDFNVTFWLICVICVVYYVAIFPLIALGKVFFERKFDMTENDASWANSILYITSAAFSPVSGYLVDKTGRNVFWVSISIFFTIIGHAMLAFTLVSPYFTMSLIGIAYSMLAGSLWPLVAYIIPQYQLGTAYGV